MSDYSPEQIDRLWQHGRQEETIFNERLNFFLVLESVLLGVTAALLNNQNLNNLVIHAFLTLGLVLTLVWSYVQYRQLHILNFMRERMKQHIPEFKESVDEWSRKSFALSSRSLLTYIVPIIFVLMWVTLQFLLP